ncbi:hypothetical protein BC830DRAFT_1084937, partial [Chytriomyces sp. MP71]
MSSSWRCQMREANRKRAVRNAKPTSAPASRARSTPAPHAGQLKIADLFGSKAKGMPDGGRGAPIGDELSQTQQQQQSEVRSKSSRKRPRVEAGLSSPVMGTESQFSIPPSAESITDERDHGNSMEDTLRRMELQMIKAQRASEAKEARCLRTLSKKDDRIASLIAQRLFQDAPGERHGREDAGRDQQPAGPPPVPTPITNQTCARGLQPQQPPPAARSSRQPLQEGSYTRHEDNTTRVDALPVTP